MPVGSFRMYKRFGVCSGVVREEPDCGQWYRVFQERGDVASSALGELCLAFVRELRGILGA